MSPPRNIYPWPGSFVLKMHESLGGLAPTFWSEVRRTQRQNDCLHHPSHYVSQHRFI